MFDEEIGEDSPITALASRGHLVRFVLLPCLAVATLLYAPVGVAPIAAHSPHLSPVASLGVVALKPVAPLAPIVQAIASDIARRFHLATAQALRITRAAFTSAAKHENVHPTLVLAVAAIESRYQPDAVNASGARGLMQVIPEAHPELLAHEDAQTLLEIEPNIRAGTAILAKYSRHGRASLYETLSHYLGSAQAAHYVKKIQGQIRHLSAVAERATPQGFANPLPSADPLLQEKSGANPQAAPNLIAR